MNETNYGTLYLVATPIGNLGDITLRALETLKTVSLIAAEDTRHSKILLQNFNIDVPLTSYHEHNKYDKAEVLIEKLKEGKDVAVITDAGTPAISDPGEVLVRRAREEDIKVTSLPGPVALITGLTISGMSTRRFCFEGFLPADKTEAKRILKNLESEERTIIMYEAPHKLKKTLKTLYETLGDRSITLCRELTKLHEEAPMMKLSEAISYYETEDPRGEYVLVIEGKCIDDIKAEEASRWEDKTFLEHLEIYMDEGLDKKTAMKKVAEDRNISKRDVYQKLLEES